MQGADGGPPPPVRTTPVFEAPLPGADVTRCPACLSPVRSDQRYCLECGERLLVDEIPPPPGGEDTGGFTPREQALMARAQALAGKP